MGRLITATIVVLQMLGTPLAGALGCSGWKPAPEARMACCDKAAVCPMRGQASTGGQVPHLSQVDADACCAAAETGDAPPLVAFALPPLVPALPLRPLAERPAPDARVHSPDDSPPSRPAVPRHLLLTVFLI